MKLLCNGTSAVLQDVTDIAVQSTKHEDGSVLITITAYVPPPPAVSGGGEGE